MSKKILSVLLTVVIMLTIVPVAVFASDITYKQGDLIEFGSYPQSQVTDESLINELNELEIDYIEPLYMDFGDNEYVEYNYGDIEYNNEKYRAVYTVESGTVSWFKYEPIKWEIIDPDTGYVLCDSVLDAQAFKYYGDYYDGNWEDSDIRAWLNDNFYNAAFTSNQAESIISTDTEIEVYENGEMIDSLITSDNVVLFSLSDALNEEYGFVELNGHREVVTGYYVVSSGLCKCASDYASTFLHNDYDLGVAWYLLQNISSTYNRPALVRGLIYDTSFGYYDEEIGIPVGVTGDLCHIDNFDMTAANMVEGICPAMHINLETFDKEQIPGDLDENGKVTPSDARTALRIAAKLETATDEMLAVADIDGNGEVTPSDARTILRIAAGLE